MGKEDGIQLDERIKGIKPRSLIIGMMVLAIIIFTGMAFVTVRSMSHEAALTQYMEKYLMGERCTSEMMAASDYLTKQVQMYTVSQDRQYMDAYFTEVDVTKRRETALSQMESYGIAANAYQELKECLLYSDQLTVQEMYAMRLVATATGIPNELLPAKIAEMRLFQNDAEASSQEQIARAQELVSGQGYQEIKEQVNTHLVNVMSDVREEMVQSQASHVAAMRTDRMIQICLLVVMLVKTALVLVVLRHQWK